MKLSDTEQACARDVMQHKGAYLYVFLGILGLILYSVLAVSGTGIWSDEAFSFGMVRLSFHEIWNLPAVDVHPPLYYFYLKVFLLVFGESLIAAKFASVIPLLFILLFGGWQSGKLFNERTGLLFMAAFLAFPPILPYAFEVRMYSLAAAFVFANIVFAYRCYLFGRKADWVLLAICSTGAAYTHYYAFLAVGLTDLALLAALVRKRPDRLKCWAGSFGLMVLMYLPWCGNLIGQLQYKVSHEYWIARITRRTILKYVYETFAVKGSKYFALLLAAAYFVLLVWAFRKRRGKAAILLLLPISVAVIGVAVSLIVRPVLVFRYLVPSLCVLPVFAALVLDQMLEPQGSRKLAVGILLIILIAGGINAANWTVKERTERKNLFDKAWVDQQACDTYLVMTSTPHTSTVLACFEENKTIYATYIESGEANPFPNIRPYETFCSSGKERIILFVDKGKQPSEELLEAYLCKFKTKIVEGDGDVFDVYELIPRSS